MRWLFHIAAHADLPRELSGTDPGEPSASGGYVAPSLEREGFIHASFADQVKGSLELHFPGVARSALALLQIDPRRLDVPLVLAERPRGRMPHISGPIAFDAVVQVLPLSELDDFGALPDRVTGTRFGFVAYDGMTLLDLVGAHDPIARIATMGFDPHSSAEIVSASAPAVWARDGARLEVARVRPPLDEFDAVIVPGGAGARVLAEDPAVLDWLRAFPENRLLASVCTGALLLGAAGRLAGRRATTHRSALEGLSRYAALPVEARVVDEGQVVTAAGVTSALDLGLFIVDRFAGPEAAERIAQQMEFRR